MSVAKNVKREETVISEVETTYGYLVNEFARAHRGKNKDLAERIFTSLELLRELWPEDCDRWDRRSIKGND